VARLRPDWRVPAAAGLAAAGAALALHLRRPGASLSTAVQEVTALAGTRKLTAAQQEMVAVIAAEFGARGLSWVVPAAVANAYAESKLVPTAIGDDGAAVGLFQVHPWGGTTSYRQDPRNNCKAILSDPGISKLASYRGRVTHAELASLFAQLVERCGACGVRPADSTEQLTYRAQLVSDIYGAELAQSVAG
jgi:hypothetical protein